MNKLQSHHLSEKTRKRKVMIYVVIIKLLNQKYILHESNILVGAFQRHQSLQRSDSKAEDKIVSKLEPFSLQEIFSNMSLSFSCWTISSKILSSATIFPDEFKAFLLVRVHEIPNCFSMIMKNFSRMRITVRFYIPKLIKDRAVTSTMVS